MSNFRAVYLCSPDSVCHARHAFIAYAQTVGFGGAELQELELAIGEALANAVEHGRAPGGSVEVRASCKNDVLTIEVKDDGRGFNTWENPAATPRSESSPRGFGIHIMRAMVDRVQYLDGGTRVVLTKRAGIRTGASGQREA